MRMIGRSYLKEADFTKGELLYLIDLAAELREEKRAGREVACLAGRNVALIFEKTSTRTRAAFEVAAHDQGAHVTYLGPGETQLGTKESVRDTARVLGRMYDGIEFRGFAQQDVEDLAKYAGVPVWNGLTDRWHPTQSLCDVLTMQDHSRKHLEEIAVAYVGDARNNTAHSLLVMGTLMGMDVRVCGPRMLWPDDGVASAARAFARRSRASMIVTDDLDQALRGADFVYTDVWLSMGEPTEEWSNRIDALIPFRVTRELMERTENPESKFMHCLPALHNQETEVGRLLHDKFGLDALEVTDEVFESPASIVFDQAENRMHTIKAVMVGSLAGEYRSFT
jgi:ornithine carbamoyltransferase